MMRGVCAVMVIAWHIGKPLCLVPMGFTTCRKEEGEMFGHLSFFYGEGVVVWNVLGFPDDMKPDFEFERALHAQGFVRVAGVDEVGRGPLAGPVTAAAVVLDPENIPEGLNDSKKLTRKARERLYDQIIQVADVSIAHASVDEIDEMNILRASHLAMVRALDGLKTPADFALVDGNMLPKDLVLPAQTIIKGDARSQSISAASIMAKICRDCVMLSLAQQHPGYGWETNMGYGSKSHMSALQNLGPTPHHRRSFKPVYKML